MRAIARMTPIRTLEIRLRSGEVLRIPHPEILGLTEAGCVAFLPERVVIFDAGEVVSVHRLAKSRNSNSRGRNGRRAS